MDFLSSRDAEAVAGTSLRWFAEVETVVVRLGGWVASRVEQGQE